MRSVTKEEYAILAAAAYPTTGDEKLPSGRRRVFTSPDGTLHGLSFAVFIKSEAGKPDELVISFRGTDSGLDRLFDLDDWPAALGKMSSQIQLALRTMFRTLFDISLHPGRLI